MTTQLREFLPAIGRLLLAVSRDPRVPRRDKVLAGAAAAYLVSPLDLFPGAWDDLALLASALRRLLRSAGYDLLREHWDGSEDGFIALLVLAGVER